jgi:hypothetical protein
MQTALWLAQSWQQLVIRSFTEHTLGAAIIGIAAIGILVLLEQEYRRGKLLTNLAYVFLGAVVSITALPLVMAGFAKGLKALEATTPVVSKISGYLYGIYDRHPLLVLIIVGIGTTGYFLKQSWPFRVSWGPVRAVCTALGVLLSIHVAGPIADLVDDEPGEPAAAKIAEAPRAPVKEAFGIAVKSGDLRYLPVPQCAEEVEYAGEYNRLMFEHIQTSQNKVGDNKP